MANANELVANTTLTKTVKKSRMPARLDFLQSASGLLLGVFMWAHMVLVSSILLGKDAMYTVSKFFEGYYFFGKSYPIIVTLAVATVFTLFILHALLALRKFPINYKQYRTYRDHMHMMQHSDTNMWFVQAVVVAAQMDRVLDREQDVSVTFSQVIQAIANVCARPITWQIAQPK